MADIGFVGYPKLTGPLLFKLLEKYKQSDQQSRMSLISVVYHQQSIFIGSDQYS